MKAFAELYAALDATTKTNEKLDALASYFASAPPADVAWAVHFLIGRRPKRLIASRNLWQWAVEEAAIPEWLYAECLNAVGDFAETIALLLPEPRASSDRPLWVWVEERLLPMRELDEAGQREAMISAWRELDDGQRFVWNKLITGEFRVGVASNLITRALAKAAGLDAASVAHRLMGDWQPTAEFGAQFFSSATREDDLSRPYPFCLAHPLEGPVEALGPIAAWLVEWKWDGIRSQLIRRGGSTFLWSRGEEIITDRFPEITGVADRIGEGTVIDGEVLSWRDGAPLPFAQLQRRIGRKALGGRILSDVPAALLAYDLLEYESEDVRERPIEWRRSRLSEIVARADSAAMVLSPQVDAASWEELTALRRESRARGVEGFMLKRLGSAYRAGRRRGDWWKWKIEPYTVDAVLTHAQSGSGKRASLFTDYTFGIWDDGALVPFAKAYSGLTDEEIREVDAFVRHNTVERFGPVHAVRPELVFEIAFEGIQKSTRHKSGIAVRFPRMARWRRDKKAEDADTVETVRALLGVG